MDELTNENIMRIITIVALVLSIWQTLSAIFQTQTLKKISGHVSTKHLDDFPEYISFLPELIGSTRKSLHIACDAPCISIFSNYEYWKKYQRAIEDLIDANKNVEITLIVLNETLSRKLIKEQFKKASENFEQWKNESTNRQKIKTLLDKTNSLDSHTFDSLDIDGLIDVLIKADELALKTTFRKAKIVRSIVPMTTYYWISDETRAIFAIPQFGDDALVEKGFQTNDQALIKSFRSVTNRYRLGLDGDA